MKRLILIMLIFGFILPKNTEAKVLPQAQNSITKSVVGKNVKATGIRVYPKLRGDKKALTVNFANLSNAAAVSYLLTYKTSTQEEGAMGSLNLSGSSADRIELLFGTCSKNVCRYHTGVKDVRLDISYALKTGKKYLKKFRIKI